MSFKKVLLEVNCGGHVSESTFNNFLDIVKHYAEDMFDGQVCIIAADEIGPDTGNTITPKMAIEWIIKNIPYKKYDNISPDFFRKALEHERNYQLNCADFKKDLSPEASNQRILNDMERMRKEYYGEK